MVGFIVTGHGEFALGLKSAIDMVAGNQEALEFVPFDGSEAASYGDTLRAAISAMREKTDGVIVFVDLLGGTPFNQAMMISNDVDGVEVVTGTNLPILIELLLTRGDSSDAAALSESAVATGRASVTHQSMAAMMAAGSDDDDEEEGL